MTRPFLLALALLALLALPALARAQVAVLRIDPGAEPFARELEAGLQGIGLVPDPGYLREARAQAIDPTSDAALEMITPLMQLRLAVVPLYAKAESIELEYRDGQTGARLGAARIERDAGGLTQAGRARLRREVVGFLAQAIEGNSPRPEAPAEDEQSASPADPALGALEPERFAGEPAARALRLRVHAGLGLGTRQAQWSREGEAQQVALGAFAAYDLGLLLGFALSDALELAVFGVYQSALAFQEVEEPRVGAPPEKVGVRAHRFAAALGLDVALGRGRGSVALTPALGFGVRNLRPEVHHLATPAYSLAGPLAQLGLRLPFGERVALQLVAEAQWLVVGHGLRERGVDGSGVGLGGEAALCVALSSGLALELTYRQAHALLSGAGASASDAERFVTLRAVGTL